MGTAAMGHRRPLARCREFLFHQRANPNHSCPASPVLALPGHAVPCLPRPAPPRHTCAARPDLALPGHAMPSLACAAVSCHTTPHRPQPHPTSPCLPRLTFLAPACCALPCRACTAMPSLRCLTKPCPVMPCLARQPGLTRSSSEPSSSLRRCLPVRGEPDTSPGTPPVLPAHPPGVAAVV